MYTKSYNLVLVVILPLIFKHSSPLDSQFSKAWLYFVPIPTDFGKV